MELLHGHITEKIIRAFYNVYNELGFGFLEKVYENALIVELKQLGLKGRAQFPIKVYYKGVIVGEYFADVLVEEKIIIEIKVALEIGEEHEAQLINYLKSTNTDVGLLLNFGPKAEFIRKANTKGKSNEFLS